MGISIYPPHTLDIVLFAVIVLAFLAPLLLMTRKFILLLKLLRPLRLVHYAGFAAGGVVLGAVIQKSALDLYLLFFATVAALVAFQGAVFLNDIFDAEIDRLAGKSTPFSKGVLSVKGSYILASGLSVFSLLLALRCGVWPFLFLLFAHVISLAYSVPLFRLKRFYPLNVFLLALAGLAVMLSGFATHAPYITFPVRMLLLVIITLTATFGTKDMADVEGDRDRGIRTLFTILGFEKGLWVNSALVLTSYLLTPLILGYMLLFWIAIPSGLLSGFFVLLAKKHTKLAEGLILALYIVFGLVILGFIASGKIF